MAQTNESTEANCRANSATAAPRECHGCIIMASGMGTRFGGNKLIASLHGKPLAQYAIEATNGLFSKRVVVTRSAEVAQLCRVLGVEAVLHDRPHRNDTVRLGMEALGACRDATFIQADQPLISANTIARLIRSAEGDSHAIWRASFKGQAGAPVLFPAWAFKELRSLPPRKGGGFVIAAHAEHVKTVEAANKWELFDVDTIEDLQTIETHLAQHSK